MAPATAACRGGNATKRARQTGIHPSRATKMRNTTAICPASIREPSAGRLTAGRLMPRRGIRARTELPPS